MNNFDTLPGGAFVRLSDIARSPKNPASVLPFSAASLWRKVKDGTFPAPRRFGQRVTAWNVGEVRAYLSAGDAS